MHSTIDELIAAGVQVQLAHVVTVGKQQHWFTRYQNTHAHSCLFLMIVSVLLHYVFTYAK